LAIIYVQDPVDIYWM